MDRFLKEIHIGEIHFRDRWQFELKSDFFPHESRAKSTYKQELYFFIPNSLQVNEDTYDKQQFYQDQTVFIRYKTPQFKLQDLYDPLNELSPINRLTALLRKEKAIVISGMVDDELKLLGNIVRSSLRDNVRSLLNDLDNLSEENSEEFKKDLSALCGHIRIIRERYLSIQNQYMERFHSNELQTLFFYVDEFISKSVNYHLTGLLLVIRSKSPPERDELETMLCEVIDEEHKHRKQNECEDQLMEGDEETGEYILYRSGLLNKFVLDALLLNTSRVSITKRFKNVIGSLSAGIAMLFFFVLFVKQGEVFLINSMPFILITVFLYILKDRMKEGIKIISYRQFAKWFSDYETDIYSHDEKIKLGKLKETVSFVPESKLSKEIIRMRNREFHYVLEDFKRPEQVLYSKKAITIFKQKKIHDTRRHALNLIYRFNIHTFLQKADNPTHDFVKIDLESHDFKRQELPKVYHLNIILKNTFIDENLKEEIEFKKFRIILDKNGIKRVEKLHG